MDNAWRILSKHFVHCRDLVTDFSHFTIPRKLDLFFPNLKIYKEETILDYPPQGSARSLLDALRDGAPKLTKASVRDLHPCFPYTRLSFLEITNFSDLQNMKALFRLLPICPRLESLSLLGMDNYDVDPFTREIKVPNLRRLSIFEHTCSSHPEEDILDTVLLSLKLPGLKAFELHCEEWPNSLDVSVNYFTSSLETLKVHICASEEVDTSHHPLLELLHRLPNLAHLEVHLGWDKDLPGQNSEYSLTILSALLSELVVDAGKTRTSSYADHILLPRLQFLSLSLADLPILDTQIVDLVLEVVSSRASRSESSPLHRLKTFKLGYHDRQVLPNPIALERVREFEQELGVEVVLGRMSP
ncbi:hypothetical protein AAF712_006289 [Marasmius tenuissimus]|uniref:Uncharacterized protein n=1 Tax=Marasmius tenuissimus TaxID=585030 RepID=A0ABR2ZYK0_9AGAR